MATLGAGPNPTLRWWRRTLSPITPPPPMATEVKRHPGDTLASVWSHIHTADKTWLGRPQGDGASVSCPLLPTVVLLSCEVLHHHYSIVRSAFPISIHSCWNWLHASPCKSGSKHGPLQTITKLQVDSFRIWLCLVSLALSTCPHLADRGGISVHFIALFNSLSTHPQSSALWKGSSICFDNTTERLNCASLPRCLWMGSFDNGSSTEWSIKGASDDLTLVEGPCIRVGPPASQSCLWVKSTIIQVQPAFDLSLSLSAMAALMSAASHWSLASRDKGPG